jgi:deoxyribodipyrimidine photo-lyase
MKGHRAIVWFRNDLRLHDNEALVEAIKNAEEIIPIYIFDPRVFSGQTTHFGFPKTGSFRAKFILESVEDLRKSLRELGSELYVRVGKPEEVLFEICQQVKSSWVFCNRERTQEEASIQDSLEQKLWSIGQEIRYTRGKMLYYTADLPYPVNQTPDIFTNFRKETERITPVRPPLPKPMVVMPTTAVLAAGNMPSLEDFGHAPTEPDARAVLPFRGGETEALARLKYYLWDSDHIKTYEETRNGLVGGDYSSKFSPYLAQGCLSPKMIYQELKNYEAARGGNKSTYWLFFELLWRDYFRLIGKKYGNRIFQAQGLLGKENTTWRTDNTLFRIWAEGKTGVPFIDANMRELGKTGFMSNRGRQNVASFISKDLNLHWLMGAEWFESQLLDYDPCSNYCNWNYVVGIGNDPRENRYFNILTQAQRYDPSGEYVRLWLPELESLPSEKIHRPDSLSQEEQTKYGVKIGLDYPKAMISTAKWLPK